MWKLHAAQSCLRGYINENKTRDLEKLANFHEIVQEKTTSSATIAFHSTMLYSFRTILIVKVYLIKQFAHFLRSRQCHFNTCIDFTPIILFNEGMPTQHEQCDKHMHQQLLYNNRKTIIIKYLWSIAYWLHKLNFISTN